MLRRNNKSIKIPFFSSRDLRATCNYTQTDFTANPGGGATQPTNEHTWPSKSNGALSKTHFCHHALLSHIPTEEQTKVSHHWLRGGSWVVLALYDVLGLCFILFSRFSWNVSEGQEVSISPQIHLAVYQNLVFLHYWLKTHKEGGSFDNCYHKQAHHI